MNFLLTNSVLLPLAALVLVPLLLHLYARARPPVYRFSSVEFLRQVLRQSVRIKRPQSLLLLALRTLLFAALIGAFLKPVFFAGQQLPGLGVRKDIVLLVDATASMAATEGGQTRFAAACAKGAEILNGLSGADTANILWLGTPTRAEFPQPGANVAYLKQALRRASATYEAADVAGALSLAAGMLRERDAAREIYVLSDFQATAWAGVTFALPPGLRLYTIKIGEAQLPNVALTAVTAEPARPLLGQKVKVFCEVQNFSPDPALTTVYLRAGDTHQSQEVRLNAGQKLPVLFSLKFAAAGEQTLAVTLSEDAFPFDNERWAIVDVVRELHVGIADHEPETAGYWRKAIGALGWANAVTLSDADLERLLAVDALWLAGWPGAGAVSGAARERITSYLQQGGMVVWSPAASASADSLRTLLPKAAALNASAKVFWEKTEKPWHLRLADPASPVLAVFASGTYGDPARGTFAGRLRLPDLSGAKPILNYDDGIPALTVLRDGGALLLWNLPLQREFSDWALHLEFVPFIGELILHHRQQTARGGPPALMAGQMLTRQFDLAVLDQDVQLRRGEALVPLVRQAAATGTRFSAPEARVPGVYAWHYRGSPLERQVLNFPTSESDLRTGPAPDFGQPGVVRISGKRSLEQLREGQPLWPWLLAAALLVAALEGLVLLRVDKR